MPEHLLEMEYAAALPQVVNSECMPEGVQGPRRRIEAKLLTQQLHIAEHVSTA
jgi:hypothetical protein